MKTYTATPKAQEWAKTLKAQEWGALQVPHPRKPQEWKAYSNSLTGLNKEVAMLLDNPPAMDQPEGHNQETKQDTHSYVQSWTRMNPKHTKTFSVLFPRR